MLVILLTLATAALVAFAWLQSGGLNQHAMFSAATPEEAVQALMSEIQAHNYQEAYASLDPGSDADLASFVRDVAGSDGSLRSYSSLQSADVSPLHADSDQALVRLRMTWSSAVGSLDDVRDRARPPQRFDLARGLAETGISNGPPASGIGELPAVGSNWPRHIAELGSAGCGFAKSSYHIHERDRASRSSSDCRRSRE